MASFPREATEIDKIAESWVSRLVRHEPTVATYIGKDAENTRLPDYSADGRAALSAERQAVLHSLGHAMPVDQIDAVTQLDLRSELLLEERRYGAGEYFRDLNVIASPAQDIRECFDLMPTANSHDWAVTAERMRAVSPALTSYQGALREGAKRGQTPALRQVQAVAVQARRTSGTSGSTAVAGNGFFIDLAATGAETPEVSPSLHRELQSAAEEASAGYLKFAQFLLEELAPVATERDAFGRERYELASESFLGATIDLDETYEWGLEELARLTHEQQLVAAEIVPGASVHPDIVAEAVALLDADSTRVLKSTAELQRWMQATSDRVVAELGQAEFDIPAEIRALECVIAPSQEGGIYYTGPSDDYSRPGRMWWSVPEGVTEFSTWRELTTVFHEGVPGHHLQIGQAVVNRGQLNEWRRQLAGTSGHAEGWALYAERLMEQLGYLQDPADRLGMLDGQRMRAARVVLDIGVHLGKKQPGERSAIWNAEYALNFMRQNVAMDDSFIRFEVLRYLGWAGQAPAYKVGQRVWETLRNEAQASANAAGKPFESKAFHRSALAIGGVRLDTLEAVMRNQITFDGQDRIR